MNQNDPQPVKSGEEKIALHWCARKIGPSHQTFFPRIIREFDDGPDEKPMIYGDGVD